MTVTLSSGAIRKKAFGGGGGPFFFGSGFCALSLVPSPAFAWGAPRAMRGANVKATTSPAPVKRSRREMALIG